MRLARPKINIGAKTLIAFTLVFWIPVIALTAGLYHSFSNSLFKEELKTVKTNLRGARVVYEERTNALQSTLKHIANMQSIKTIFSRNNKFEIEQLLINIGKENNHIELLMAVDGNQKVMSRRNGRNSDIIILGDALSRALMTGETIVTTELITREMVSLEDETLATRIKDIGIGQFVIAPVRSEDKIDGAIIAGIVLTGESWLGNSIYEQFGAELALFAGETFESFYLHTTTSLPHATWVIGQKMPELLSDQISLGKSYYGVPDINGEPHIVAFEPIMDSRLRVIGAIGVSKETYDTTIVVNESISRILMYVAPAALLLALLITFVIYRDITRPVNFIINAMKTFEKGSKDIVIDIKTGDEFEQLGKGFNNMAKSVTKREERIKKHYQVAKLLMSTIDISELSDKILNVVTEVTESQLGILYLCDIDEQKLKPVVQYGCGTDLPELGMNEGLPGHALRDRKCIIITPGESDAGLDVEMGYTRLRPAEVAYIPLVFKDSNIGSLVIGRVSRFTDDEKEQFTYLGNQISVALDNTIVHRRVQELSICDPLTGLYNRRFLTTRLAEEWSRCVRQHEPLSIILGDIDNFKMINDTYGHDRGDEVLREMGRVLKQMTRKEDVSARYGGDEFVAVYPNMGSTDAAKKAEAIRNALIQSSFPWTDTEISVSIGVATFPEIKVNSAEELIQKSDKAMYQAKSGGQDRIVVNVI